MALASSIWTKKLECILRELKLDVEQKNFSEHSMIHGQTNKFATVKSDNNKIYLIRQNGNLWPPFSRETEAYNLKELQAKGIRTNVIYNQDGYQISYLKPEENRFSMITNDNEKTAILEKIITIIKNYQTKAEFQNVLSVRDTLVRSFNALKPDKQEKWKHYCDMIGMIIFIVDHERKKKVSSHNDLLPSDIYYVDDEIFIVDWEYSALNHPLYDLAHFAIASSLTTEQEDIVLNNYDQSINHFSPGQVHSFILLKAIISFLLLIWECNKPEKEEILSVTFLAHFKHAFGYALHKNLLSHYLALSIPLDDVVSDLLEPFIFRQYPIVSEMNSCLLESIQTIMNDGRNDSKDISGSPLREQLKATIKQKYSQDNYMIEGKSIDEFFEEISKPGCWNYALTFFSKIFTIKFYVYQKMNGSIQLPPLEFGDNLSYFHLCAYLIFDNTSQYYQPLCLFNAADTKTVVTTKFLMNSITDKLLKDFIRYENSESMLNNYVFFVIDVGKLHF